MLVFMVNFWKGVLFVAAEYAKLPLIRPYLDPHNNLYIHGVNFASGGSGALLESHQGSVWIHSSNFFIYAWDLGINLTALQISV